MVLEHELQQSTMIDGSMGMNLHIPCIVRYKEPTPPTAAIGLPPQKCCRVLRASPPGQNLSRGLPSINVDHPIMTSSTCSHVHAWYPKLQNE